MRVTMRMLGVSAAVACAAACGIGGFVAAEATARTLPVAARAAIPTAGARPTASPLPSPRPTVTARVEHGGGEGEDRLGAVARLPSAAPRVFASSETGFATADEPTRGDSEGAIYPLRTVDGGRRWTIDGPAFMVPGTAQAGIALGELGIAGRDEYWAYGPGTQVLLVTDDAGRSWDAVAFGNAVESVSRVGRDLVAYVDVSNATGSRGATWQYVSADGGRVWRDTTLTPPA